MRIKFFLLLVVTVAGFALAVMVPFNHRVGEPLPPEAFLGQAKRDWFDAAAEPDAPEKPSTAAVVEAASSSGGKFEPITWNCTGANASNFDCYEKYYAALVGRESIRAAFDDLRSRYPGDGYARAMCHPLTHVIGREASEKFATPGEAYGYGDGFCWSGYYHGVLEGIIGRIGLKNLAKDISTICSDIKGREGYSFNYYNCVHGLGHGVMAITEDELFQSLDYCDKLTGNWEQQSCGSGAFMENIIVDGKNHVTKFLNPADLLYPCNASPDKYKNTCYLMQTSYMLKINGRNFKATFDLCSKVEAPYRDTCYQSLGRDASGQSTSEVGPTKNICLLGNDGEQQSNCVIGAVKDFISYFHSDVQAKQLCNSFADPILQEICFSTAEAYYRQF
ncbi:MAG: hypothetical protein Q8P49_03645 [Candidatus Liptonbacteria bacterium]|nr:hypothetical protein [Candidatus Liptonbacteria bacterium]